jgi:hypothetical protein
VELVVTVVVAPSPQSSMKLFPLLVKGILRVYPFEGITHFVRNELVVTVEAGG